MLVRLGFFYLIFSFSSFAVEDYRFFEEKIRPALEDYCYRCHSDQEKRIKGGLLLDTRQGLLTGGESGPALVPGDLGKSLLWSSINYHDLEMPPKKQMPAVVIADFKKWILAGAPDPRKQKITVVSDKLTPEKIEKEKSFWSFQLPKYKPAFFKPKTQKDQAWSKQAIDRYIYVKTAQKDIQAVEPANARALLRRLYFDLTGLAPSFEEVSAFEVSYQSNPDSAIVTVLDDLLARDTYGEHWGRHWLDIARYAESTGRELNATYPHAWRYRDYVIKSFNEDKPYNQFLQEQIAGDLLSVDSDKKWAENLVATSFLALGSKSLPEQDKRQFQADLIDEQIDLISRGVMGLTVSCARCHDHKFDPIAQKDYYALAGIFQSTKTFYGTSNFALNRHATSLIRLPMDNSSNSIRAEGLSQTERARLQVDLKKYESQLTEYRSQRRKSRNDKDAKVDPSLQRKLVTAERQVSQIKERLGTVDDKGRSRAFTMGVLKGEPVKARILERGEVSRPAQEVERGFVQVLVNEKVTIPAKANGRLELAAWVTSEKNPLTARVMVNRIWMHLFGQGLVDSPENFGKMGKRPSHPELLDYLALRFQQKGWSIKKLIKEITLSQAYRLAAVKKKYNFAKDPENQVIWRMNAKRLSAESLRDNILQVAGALKKGAPSSSLVAGKTQTFVGRNEAEQLKIQNYNDGHRSIYLPTLRNALPSLLAEFDGAECMETSSRRESNTTAGQALYMLNDSFVIEFSEKFAKSLIRESKVTGDQIGLAFQRAFQRKASSAELRAAQKLYQDFFASRDLRKYERDQRRMKALAAVCQALFASAEFRYQN